MKERGKTWLARKLSLGKVAEKDDTSNQSDEDRVEIDQEDGRKNDATGASPPRVEQSPVIAGGGLLSYPVTPERGALAPAGAAAGSCDHERASPSTYNGIYPESTKSDKSDELKEHLDTVKSSLEEILASGYQNSNSSKATDGKENFKSRSESGSNITDVESQTASQQGNEGVPVEHVRRLTSTVVDMLRYMSKQNTERKVSREITEGYNEQSTLLTGSPSEISDDKLSLSDEGSSIKDSEISSKTALMVAQFLPQPEYKGDDVMPFYMDNDSLEDGKRDDLEQIPKILKKNVKINWSGLIVFIFFICAFITYIGIRAAKTLGLGGSLWYGVVVLIVEILGGIAMLPYGVCLTVKVDDPVPQAVTDALSGAPARTSLSYHIRVLIPCYKEPLDVISKTFLASMYCAIPVNCKRTVYLLDDGKDPEKRSFVRSLGVSNAVYISGRKRAKGEMNGKSANINNAMRLIYPGEDLEIPTNEVLCVFDADQVPNADFFSKTVPLLDGGEDVAMVLTPQAFYNLNHDGDIFNHANVHFWDYTQPGYNALGLISCTGTNFLLRAKAFKDAGWFPEWTLTEDFALGIELKRRNWQCRYVDEYLALGEAPDEVRNCFQQRSRWAKGHFQVFFGKGRNPAFGQGSKGLSLLMRWMYGSVVLSYFSAFLGTPLLMIVPMVTVWFGAFPIVINFWAALAITIYYTATLGLMYYTRSIGHLKSMWFASVSNSILWFAFLKAMYRSTIGKWFAGSIVFKVTAKGLQKLNNLPIRDVWMATIWMIFSIVSLIFGLITYFRGDVTDTPLAISIIFMLYNLIPLYLLLQYAMYRGKLFFTLVCRIMMLLSTTLTILGIVLVWVLYPNAYDYQKSLANSLFFFDTQRLGQLPESFRVSWRQSSFPGEKEAFVYLAENPNDTLLLEDLDAFSGFVDAFGRRRLMQELPSDSADASDAFSSAVAEQLDPTSTATSADPFGSASADPFGSASADPLGSASTDPFGSAPADPFGSASADPFGSASADPFGSASADPFGSASADPFGSASADPFGSASADPFGSASADPFGSASADPFGSASADPFGSASADPFGSGLGDPFSSDPFGGDPFSSDPFASDPFGAVKDAELELATDFPWDLSGGWMTGMKAGNIKMTTPIAFTTTMLAWGFMGFHEAFENAKQTEYLMESVKWGSDYLMKMHRRIMATNQSLLVTRVGDAETESRVWYRPEDGVSRDAFAVDLFSDVGGYGADLGGSISAGLAAASTLFRGSGYYENNSYPDLLLSKAKEVYDDSKMAKYQFSRGDYNASELYNSSTVYDDMAWAAGWLFKATKEKRYLDDMYKFYVEHLEEESSISDWKYAFDWDNVFWPTNLLMAQETGNSTFKRQSKEFLRNWMCANNAANYTRRGRAFNAFSAPLGATANVAMASFMYADMIESEEPSVAGSYRCWGLSQVRYMLGDSSRSLVVGQGHNAPERTQDRSASCPERPGVCNRVTSYLSPDPDTYELTGALVHGAALSDDYVDERTNDASMVGIENNAGFTGALAGAALLPGGMWEVCLQQFGIYRDDPVCGSFVTL